MHDLTVEDLRRNPVWEFDGSPDNAATVTAVTDFEEPDTRYYIAYTRFQLSDGSVFWGYCSPVDDSGLDYIQPVIICGNEHVALWYDEPPDDPPRERLRKVLGRELDKIFPISFECQVAFEGTRLAGVVTDVGGAFAP